jgi:hypothetical protein
MKLKNPHAAALGRLGGKKRAENLSKAERINIAKKAVAARNDALSRERRSEIARLAAQARHGRPKPKRSKQ